jgi:hypothetical protein
VDPYSGWIRIFRGALIYTWTTSNGVIVAGGDTPIAEVNAPGVYQLLVTGMTSGCKDSTSVTVTKDANIPDADAGPDKLLTCDSLLFVLGGNSETGPGIIYTGLLRMEISSGRMMAFWCRLTL